MKYFLIVMAVLFAASCKNSPRQPAAVKTDTYYTCSMHPQVMQEGPGQCPICGMELIPVNKTSGHTEEDLVLSPRQVQLGNIQLDTVGMSDIGDKMMLTATLNVDETRSASVNARIAGRIERLYHKNTGEYLRKGDRLYDLYSEALNTAKQEYILALEREKTLDNPLIDLRQLTESARNKLLLWGMSEAQVEELARTKKASTLTTFYSPAEGYITELQGHDGDYLAEGAPILRLADLSVVWAEAQVYTSRLPALDRNATAVVRLPDFPGKEWTGHIQFVNPEINPDTRINLVRIEVQNKEGILRPGMPAYVTLANHRGHLLTLPGEAVIRNENSSVVWVQTAHNTFRSVMVDTGREEDGRLEIRSGLKEGDIVVISGAYLLNSEYIFRHGASPMASMDMKKM